MALTTVQQVQAAYLAVNRVELNETAATAVASAIDGGVTTLAAYSQGLIAQAATTTQAAFALSSFIEGAVPTSARIDSLTAFATTQHDYYVNVLQSANAQLGAYEALGKAFAADPSTTADFAARYGALSTTDFVTTAYAQIFDVANSIPSAAALANLVAQVEYFTSIYTQAGIPAADAALQAKGAVLGQIIGYAFTDATRAGDSSLQDKIVSNAVPLSVMSQIVDDAVNDVPSAVYGSSVLGADITIVANTDIVGPGGAAGFQTTVYGDTVTGTVGAATLDDATKIDGALGVDTFVVTLDATPYAPGADTVKSIEIIKAVSTAAAASIDLTNVTDVTKFIYDDASTASLTVLGLDTATEFHITDTTGAVDIGYKTAPTAAKISIDANYAGVIEFSDVEVTAVTANVTAAASGVNFADNELESVTVTSKGSISIQDIGTGLKTLDLSGVGTFSNSNFAGEGFANAVTATLSKGADTFVIDANHAHVVTLGAGADTLTFVQAGNVNDISTNAAVVASVASVTDFSTADSDILNLTGGARVTLDATNLGQIAAQADLSAAATLAGTFSSGADDWAIFNFGSDAYALFDAANDGFNVGDTLIKITGVQVADFTATNLFVA
jgi:hypothetical protein